MTGLEHIIEKVTDVVPRICPNSGCQVSSECNDDFAGHALLCPKKFVSCPRDDCEFTASESKDLQEHFFVKRHSCVSVSFFGGNLMRRY